MMLFNTPKEREQFLISAACNPESVYYGAAMEHAESARLGLWGDVDALKQDCAFILQAEIWRMLSEHEARPNRDRIVDERAVYYSRAFNAAFDAARRRDVVRVGSILADVARSVGNAALLDAAEHECRSAVNAQVPFPLRDTCRFVYEEIVNDQVARWARGEDE